MAPPYSSSYDMIWYDGLY